MNDKLRRILIAVCALVVVGCIAWAVVDGNRVAKDQSERNREQADLQDHDAPIQQLKPGASSGLRFSFSLIPTACADEVMEEPAISEDFAPLLEVNEHAVGWITAGERIDEPVVQYDNEYYLTHDLYGQEDSNGVVFVNEANCLWPRDQVILLHGHNMRNQGRFGTLANFADYKYVQAHPIVTFRTIYDDADVYYVPVSGFTASMLEDDLYYFNIMQINFADDEAYETYIAKMRRRSRWQSPVSCGPEDELLMLVTCNYAHDEGRFILVCRKLHDDETPESIMALMNP